MSLPVPILHWWRPLKWGDGGDWDCRECRICGRFEVYGYGSFHKAPRSTFEPIRATTTDRKAK